MEPNGYTSFYGIKRPSILQRQNNPQITNLIAAGLSEEEEEKYLNILKDNKKDALLPFGDVRKFYTFVNYYNKKNKVLSRWAFGAENLVKLFEALFDQGQTPIMGDAIDKLVVILKELNLAIANVAVEYFHQLHFGSKKGTADDFEGAYNFDLEFVKFEQIDTATPLYERYKVENNDAYLLLNAIFHMDIAFSVPNPMPSLFKLGFPPGKVDLHKHYGVRLDIPMFMLYPYRHVAVRGDHLFHLLKASEAENPKHNYQAPEQLGPMDDYAASQLKLHKDAEVRFLQYHWNIVPKQ